MPAATLAAVWGALSAALLIFAGNFWPIVGGDSISFIPPMQTWAHGEGLVNQVWPASREHDPTGQGRLVSHGFLFEMVIGSFAPPGDFKWILVCISVMESAALGAWALIFWRIANAFAPEPPGWWATGAGCLSLSGLATMLIGLRERPEVFVVFLLGMGVLLLFILRSRWHWLVIGCLVGALAATHPVACILSGLGAAAYGAWLFPVVRLFVWLVKLAAAALLFFLILILWYPYSLRDWVAGCLHHSAQVMGRPVGAGAFYYWITVPQATFYGLVYVLGGCLALVLLYSWRAKPGCRAGVALSLGALVAVGYYFGGRTAARNYNLLTFAPVLFAIILATVSSWAGRREWQVRVLLTVTVVVLALSGTGFYRTAALFPSFLKRGIKYEEARQRVGELRKRVTGVVWLDNGFYPLVDDFREVTFSGPEMLVADAILLQQANRATSEPPTIPGYALAENKFETEIPRLCRVKLGHSTHGYNYAIYLREKTESKK